MNSNGMKCSRCSKPIFAADKQEKYEGKIYHSGCFKCSHIDCGIKLTTQSAKGFNKMPYCQSHVPNEPFNRRTTFSDHTYVNVPPLLSNQSSEEYDEIHSSSASSPPDQIEVNKTGHLINFKNEIRTIIQESSPHMVDEIFTDLSRDLNIVVCGSPRVGKSTLINVMCGKEVAKAKEGMASVTHQIQCYTQEGQCNTGSNLIHYKYHFWDTPGFESWERADIKTKVKEIIEKPESKPLCMIFCASPGTFVDLAQLEWLLNLCINKRHIFCALVCTNKHAGQSKSRRAVLDEFNKLLSKFVNDPPRIENEITFYGNVGLCAAVNSEPYEDDDRVLPPSGTNELIFGIMESLVDEQVLNWCFLVLENEGFWNDCHQKVSGLFEKAKGTKKVLKKLFGKKIKEKSEHFKSFLPD